MTNKITKKSIYINEGDSNFITVFISDYLDEIIIGNGPFLLNLSLPQAEELRRILDEILNHPETQERIKIQREKKNILSDEIRERLNILAEEKKKLKI